MASARVGFEAWLTPDQQDMVTRFLPMAWHFAHMHAERLAFVGVTEDEAASFACLVLMQAARTFDPAKGAESTHMMNALQCRFRYTGQVDVQLIHLPRDSFANAAQGLPVASLADDLWRTEDGRNVLSFAETRYGGIVESDDADDFAARYAPVARAMSKLPPRQRQALTLRLGLDGGPGLTLKAAGRVMGLTKERVRQLQHQAMKTLRRKLGAGPVEPPAPVRPPRGTCPACNRTGCRTGRTCPRCGKYREPGQRGRPRTLERDHVDREGKVPAREGVGA